MKNFSQITHRSIVVRYIKRLLKALKCFQNKSNDILQAIHDKLTFPYVSSNFPLIKYIPQILFHCKSDTLPKIRNRPKCIQGVTEIQVQN